MNYKQIVLVAGILAAVSTAGVLDTNDVKLNTTLSLGSNPAAIAANKQSKVEAGTIFLNKTKQSAQLKNSSLRGVNLMSGKDVNSSSFNDASKFAAYTDVWEDNWFSIRYAYESNLYPNFKSTIDTEALVKTIDARTGGNAAALTTGLVGAKGKAKITKYQKDALEKTSVVWAKDWHNGLITGVEIASNIYTLNDNTRFNKAARDIYLDNTVAVALGVGNNPFEDQDSRAYALSGSYWSGTLGGIYTILDGHKISLSQRFTEDRGIYTDNDTPGDEQTSYYESIPNETGLAYIYTVNSDLELAATYKAFWGTKYERHIISNYAPESVDTVTILPCNSYGFAVSYKVLDGLELQGYGNYLRGYKAVRYDTNDKSNKQDSAGWDVSQFGGNVQWTSDYLGGGTLLLGSYVTKLVNEDKSGQVFDITNTSLSYSYAFDSLFTPTIQQK